MLAMPWMPFTLLLTFTRSLCGDESGLRAGGGGPLASLGKVLVEPVTAIIIVYAYFKI